MNADPVMLDLGRYMDRLDALEAFEDKVETRLYNLRAPEAFDLIDEHFCNSGGEDLMAALAEWVVADGDNKKDKEIALHEKTMAAMSALIEKEMRGDV